MRNSLILVLILVAATLAIIPLLGPYLATCVMNSTNFIDPEHYVKFKPSYFRKGSNHES